MFLFLLWLLHASWGSWNCPEALIRSLQDEKPDGSFVAAEVDPRIRKIDWALSELDKGNRAPADQLLAEQGAPAAIRYHMEDLGDGKRPNLKVDGFPAVRIPSAGAMNLGVFRLDRGTGPRALKIVLATPRLAGKGRIYLLLSEWKNGLLGEWAGGPKITGVGFTDFYGERGNYDEPFLEMAWLFPNEETRTIKFSGGLGDCFNGEESEQRAADRIATLMIRVFALGIAPIDADMILTRNGDASWIDTGEWGPESAVFVFSGLFKKILADMKIPSFERRLGRAILRELRVLRFPPERQMFLDKALADFEQFADSLSLADSRATVAWHTGAREL